MKVKELKRIIDDMIHDGKEEYDVKGIEIIYDSESDSGILGLKYYY